MDPNEKTDYYCLADEKFDFDASLSSVSSRDEEEEDNDEVFLGPVGDMERCISIGMESQAMDNVSSGISEAMEPSWSPLTIDKFELICKEAHQLASQIKVTQQEKPMTEETVGTKGESKSEPMEEFVEDTATKLGLFNKPPNPILNPIKRETFCLQDSPKKQLPLVIQQRLTRGYRSSTSGVVAPLTKGYQSTASPASNIKTQSKMVLRGRAGLGAGGVLPSKPTVPATSTSTPNTANTRVGPTEKTTRLPHSNKAQPRLKHNLVSGSKDGSCEDLVSDSASVASDVSDSSLNSSLHGKAALAPPSKIGLQNLSAVKAPPSQSRRLVEGRRNTSSSVSSFNSSLSGSPTGKGKLNSSLNSSVNGPGGQSSSSMSRRTNSSTSAVKARRSGIYGKSAGPPTTNNTTVRCSISAQARKPSEVDRSKLTRSTPLKRPEPTTPVILTPAKRVNQRTSSVGVVSSLSTTKLQIGNLQPTRKVKGPRQADVSSPDAPRIMKPEKLSSECSVESLPQNQAVTPLKLLHTPSAGVNKSLQTKMRRSSALPTPVSRSISGIPVMTPKSSTRACRSSSSMSGLPTSASRSTNRSAKAEMTASGEELLCIQPFCLEEDKPSISPPIIPQPETQPKAPSPGEGGLEGPEHDQGIGEQPEAKQQNQDPEPNGNLIELQSAVVTHPLDQETKTTEANEVLLIDVPAPVLQPQEKLLIDLSNTPDLIRTASVKSCGGKELIDLSSPLIKWSPEDRNENIMNEPPLINLSF